MKQAHEDAIRVFLISPTQHRKQTKYKQKSLEHWPLSKTPGTAGTLRLPPSPIPLPKTNTKGEAQEQLLILGARGLTALLGCPPWGVPPFPTGFLVGAAPFTATAFGA